MLTHGWALRLGLLVALLSAAAAAPARTGAEWLEQLSEAAQGCSGVAEVQLASGGAAAVSQAEADKAGLALPLHVPPDCTLRLTGGEGGRRAWDASPWAPARRRKDLRKYRPPPRPPCSPSWRRPGNH